MLMNFLRPANKKYDCLHLSRKLNVHNTNVVMGSALSTKQKWVERTRSPLEFNLCDNQIVISDNKRTASWTIDQSHIHGQCYSNRTVKINERITLTAHGSGFLDIGLTDIHPVQMVNEKNMFFKYIVARVLYFEPYSVTFRVSPNGEVMAEEADESKERHVFDLGPKSKSHWLVVKMGCGDLSVTITTPSAESKQSKSNQKSFAAVANQKSNAVVANQISNPTVANQKLNTMVANQKSNATVANQKSTATIATQTSIATAESQKSIATVATQTSTATIAKNSTATVATQKSTPSVTNQKTTATQTSIATVAKQTAKEQTTLLKR